MTTASEKILSDAWDRHIGAEFGAHSPDAAIVQLGLLEPGSLPVVGAEAARSVADRKIPLNGLLTLVHAAR